MNSLAQPLIPTASVRRDLWLAFIAAALFSGESWALGPLSWIYGYGSGLETVPAIKALSFDSRNFSLWVPFVVGGVDRLSFWGNANPLGPKYLLFSTLPAWLANGLHHFLQYFVSIFLRPALRTNSLASRSHRTQRNSHGQSLSRNCQYVEPILDARCG